jgi:hypothetical protein
MRVTGLLAQRAPLFVHPKQVSRPATRDLFKKLLGFPVMLGFLLAAMVYIFASRSISDPDIWWHLRNAEYLVRDHAMVRHDFYSFTVAGAPWINHEWLGEVPYYFAWQWAGMRGLYLLITLLVEGIMLGVFALASAVSRNVKAAFFASWLAVYLATVSFGPRTLLFGWIFLVVELFVLHQFREGKDKTWVLSVLFVLWVNTHGSWLIGMVFLAVFFAAGLAQGTWGRVHAQRWTRPQLRKLALVSAGCLGALFLNPWGYHLVFYPFDLAFRQTLNVGHVQEWQTLDLHSLRGKIVFFVLALTLVLAFIRKQRWRLEEVAFVLIGFYAAMTYMRFMFLAAIVVTPLLAKELNFLPPYRGEDDRPWLNLAIMAGALTFAVWLFPSQPKLWDETVREYPVKATPFLQQFQPQGRVFTDYNWGGYLIWNVRQIPVFVDSRVDIFEYSGVFSDYLDAMGVKKTLEVLDKYHVRYVLFEKETPLSYLLQHNPGWKALYDDGVTILLERSGR